MIVFSASDKGGTGRSVTSANIAFRRALAGDDVCYLDFDFGSPTVAAVFDVPSAMGGIGQGGLHSYLQGQVHEPVRLDVWAHTEHQALRHQPAGSGSLQLLPGDRSGGEFAVDHDSVIRCIDLFLRLHSEFDVVLVDLSAGRSYAVDLALEVTARPELHGVGARWLIHHRWTHQHVVAGVVGRGAMRAFHGGPHPAVGHAQDAVGGRVQRHGAAARQLRRTLESSMQEISRDALVLPHLGTRDGG